MASTTGQDQTETLGLPVVGQEGDTCEQCGSVLATDQRYCLNCGWRRGESRVDYEQRLNGGTYAANGATAASRSRGRRHFAVDAGIRDPRDRAARCDASARGPDREEGQRQHADRRRTGCSDDHERGGRAHRHHRNHRQQDLEVGQGRRSGTAPGAGNVVQGGSGSTAGVAAANPNASVTQNAKSGPDVVATQGKPAPLDPGGQAGGGSGATCIGC